MERQMTEYVKKEDLFLINRALNDDKDVRIQRTKDGYRIVEDSVKVILKAVVEKR
jgi:hypothetical protein